MDDADIADENSARILEFQLRQRKPTPKRTGYCLNCEALLILDHAFCDALCREDYERRNPLPPAA